MTHLISLDQLKQQPQGFVIFDCRFRLNDEGFGLAAYKAGHLPGAYFLDLNNDLSSKVQLHGGRHPLPNAEVLTQKLRDAGVNNLSSILLYDDSRGAYAARAWWLLKWLGLEKVYLLDGGFNTWRDSGEPLDRRTPPVRSSNFNPITQQNMSLSRDQILAALNQPGSLTLIDSREPRRYQGLEEPIDPIAGHIPGAINYCWQDITDESGFFKSTDELRTHWQSLNCTQDIGVYCGSGVTACVNLFALDMLGIKAKLYPGSWSDWCSYPAESPIE